MILHQFRQHLAEQVRSFPSEPNAAAESYAVTTAALSRRILDYLNAKDLTLPNGFQTEEPPYKLGTVLDRIIHFKVLGQDGISFDFPGTPDLVTLYSDKNLRHADHMYFRLADYVAIMEKLANDELLVGHYLLRQAITFMGKLENTELPTTDRIEKEVVYQDLRRATYEIILDSWRLVYGLDRSGSIAIEPIPIECYLILSGGRTECYDRITTRKELVDRYGEKWKFGSFNPSRFEVNGSKTYCTQLTGNREDGKHGLLRLALPFGTIDSMFSDVRKQIADALVERDLSAKRTEG